jgi:hypothetical protein
VLPTVTVPEEACLPVINIEYLANGLIPLKLAGTCVGKTAQKSVPSLDVLWAIALEPESVQKKKIKKDKYDSLNIPLRS